jgi:hypothetical protein
MMRRGGGSVEVETAAPPIVEPAPSTRNWYPQEASVEAMSAETSVLRIKRNGSLSS